MLLIPVLFFVFFWSSSVFGLGSFVLVWVWGFWPLIIGLWSWIFSLGSLVSGLGSLGLGSLVLEIFGSLGPFFSILPHFVRYDFRLFVHFPILSVTIFGFLSVSSKGSERDRASPRGDHRGG